MGICLKKKGKKTKSEENDPKRGASKSERKKGKNRGFAPKFGVGRNGKMAPMWGDGKKKGILVGKGNKKEKWPKRPPKKNLGKNGGEKP